MFYGVTQMDGVGNTLWGQLPYTGCLGVSNPSNPKGVDFGLKWVVDFHHFELK